MHSYGASETYLHDQISSGEASVRAAHARAIGLMADGAKDVVFLERLRCAIAEIFTALNETLRDERSKAAECLQRAQVMLESVDRPTAPARAAPPRGLAPWRIRRVLTYIDSNLHNRIRNKDLAGVARLSEFHFNVAF